MSLGSLLYQALTHLNAPLFLVVATLGCYYVWRSSKSRGLPPGPPSWPLIGSLLSLRSSDVREELFRLARQYGDMFTMDMGVNRTVMLASYDAIKAALVKNGHALSGRPQDIFVFKDVSEGKGKTLRWRHNDRDGVSNHQPHDCLPNRLFRCRSKKTSKLRVTGLCAGNSPLTGEFPAQRASNGEMFPFDDVIMKWTGGTVIKI